MSRKLSDLDFVALRKDEQRVIGFLLAKSYRFDKANRYVAMMSNTRYMFEHPTNGTHVDIFFDKLEMCHTIDFTRRLPVDFPTISLADLLLEKMQIAKINDKDIKDTLVLFWEHEVGDHDKEVVNQQYISKLLSENWGFYYTVTQNLKKVRDSAPKYDIFTSPDCENIYAKIDKLSSRIEREPKSLGWTMRAKNGTKKRWYTEVEDVSR